MGVLAVLFLLPAFCLWLTPNTMSQTELVDTSVYGGYIANYESLIERYGATYYSLRLAGIFPGKFFAFLFGPDNGYDVTRYWVLLVGVVSFFAIVSRFQSKTVSLVATVFFCFSPLYLRSIAWEYVDGIAIGYVLAGFAFCVQPTWRWHSNMLAAGFCFSLAVNTNPFTLAIIGIFIPSALILRESLSWRIVLIEGLLTISGLAFGHLVLAAGMNQLQPTLGVFFEGIAFKMGIGFLSSGAEVWFKTLGSYLSDPQKIFTVSPTIVLCGAACLILQRPPPAQRQPYRVLAAFTLYLGLIVAFYLAFHYAFGGAIITRVFYLSYVAVPLYLLVSAMMGYATRALPPREAFAWLSGAALVLLLLWSLDASLRWEDWISPVIFFAVSALFVLTCILGPPRPRPLVIGVLLLTLVLPGVFLRSAEDYGVLQSASNGAINRDVRKGALQLIADVERLAPPSGGPVGFWYDKDLHSLRALQSTYLYQYSLLPSVPPVIDAGLKKALARHRFVVVLALSEHEVTAGAAALAAAGIKSRLSFRRNVDGKAFSFSYAILDLLPSDDEKGALVQLLPLGNAVLMAGQVQGDTDALNVRTDPRRWFYALGFQLPIALAREGLAVCARIKVLSGSIGLATVTDNGQRFVGEREIAPRDSVADYCLPLPADATQIIFRNWAPNGASDFLLENIGLYRISD